MLRDLRPALPDSSCAILRYFDVAGCALSCDPSNILRDLGWKAQHTDLAKTIETTWRFSRLAPLVAAG
jgi:hypothetical protein